MLAIGFLDAQVVLKAHPWVHFRSPYHRLTSGRVPPSTSFGTFTARRATLSLGAHLPTENPGRVGEEKIMVRGGWPAAEAENMGRHA
jgi:hypothetical protein